MRPAVILVILLSVVCSPGVILHAQSCIAPDRYGGTSVTGTTCEYVYEEGGNRCERGDTVTFTPLLLSGPFTPATCPTQVKWDFGDGTKVTSNAASVTHTYATTGRYYVQIDAPVTGGTSHNFYILIASGIISFPRSVSIDEGLSATIAITRTGNLSRPGTVDYRTAGAVLPLEGTLSFAAGEASKDLLIQTEADTVSNDGDRTARLFLSNPTGDWIFDPGGHNEVVVVVRDNDLPAIHQCAQTELHVNEAAEVATFELTRSQNTSGTTTGYVKIFREGWTHSPFGYLRVTFAPGETTRSADLRWEDDSLYQGTRQWGFICGGEAPGVSAATSEGKVIVTDDEPYPTLIAPASIEVTETDTPQLISIPLSFVPPFGDWHDLDVVLEHETTGEPDLKLLPFYFPYDKIELEINGDDLPEPDESLYVRLIGAAQKWIPLTIRDDDRPSFPYSFERESYEFDEALGGSVVVQRSGSPSSPVELLLRVDPNIPGAAVETIPVLFASGESSKEVPLALDDTWFTGTRHATMKLELDGFAGATASLIVNDNEAIPSLSVGDGSVREGNLNQKPSIEIPVTLTAPVGATLQLTISPLHVSTDAADFAAAPQIVTIFPGELTGKAVFDVNGDTAHESDETFNVTITSCCDGLATVARQTGTATIVNDDGSPTQTLYRLALGATSFKEADRWLSIPVHRFGIVSGTTHAILKLTASDERVFAPRTVSFAPNETVNDVQFYINDFLYSGNTTVKVELFDGDQLLETKSVTILDDELRPVTRVSSGSAREGNARNAVPLNVSVNPPSRMPIIVRLHSRSGSELRNSAVLAEDFPVFDKTVEIPPGTYDYEVLVPIYNDQIRENTESFYVDVTVDGVPLSFPTNVYITDDDAAYIEHESYVARGTLTTISVHFPSPAPAKDTVYFQADPAILEGPQSVPVAVGARSVSFQVLAKRSGALSFAVEPPTFLPPARLAGTINFFDEHTVTLTPAALELAPGTSATVMVTIWPGQPGFTTRLPDWTTAALERSNVDGKPSLIVYGIAPGQTEILVKLPVSVGGATARLPVVVKEPEKPGRKRAARH